MAETLKEQIRADLNAARKERDKLRTAVLSTFLSEIRNREIEKGGDVADPDVQSLLTTAIKRRREAAAQMRAGNREELAQKEDEEARMLQAYLPPQLEEGDVREMVRKAVAAGAADLGGIMQVVMPRVKGRFEGKELNRIAKEELGLSSSAEQLLERFDNG
ncbi:MAG TPA: GatB/YqeY domain-containing protein [Longimicrobiaceae bacterium]|nr:GatB/YqeY domain-containing protein [Longimicrobiaceae bacterium]